VSSAGVSRLTINPESRPAAGFVAGGAVLIGVYYAYPSGGDAQSAIYDTLGLVSVLAILWAIRHYRPETPLPWFLFALGNLSFVIGDIIFDVNPNISSPSVADGFYLAGYPLIAAGLILLFVHAGGHHRRAAVAEAGIATFAFALIQWTFVMHPALMGSGSYASRAVAATYPAGDVVLLAGFAGFLVSPAWRKPSFWLLLAAVASLLIGDEINGLASSYTAGGGVDATWMFSYVLFGAAALHPSMRELAEPRRAARLRVSTWRIALLTAAMLSPAAVLLIQYARGENLEIPAVVTAEVAISLLVMWRLTGIVRALERLRMREREARAEAEAAREQLSRQNELLVEADRLKDEFVALISHDLRTPLTSIVGYTELALDDDMEPPLDEERRSYLEVVSRGSERLLRLVDDLLFVARLQAGKGLQLELKELDLAGVAAQVVDEAQPRAATKSLTLRAVADGPVIVEADKGRLFQLLENLISNAIKFTPRDGTVEVRASVAPDGGVLEVSDTGVGVTPREAERMFERFFRASSAVTNQVPGTGLGLYIARAIAEAHGGRISATSDVGQGTTFRIELPAHATPQQTDGVLVA
jgi:signal transduction histidine kinase